MILDQIRLRESPASCAGLHACALVRAVIPSCSFASITFLFSILEFCYDKECCIYSALMIDWIVLFYEKPTRSGVFNSFQFQDGLAYLVSTTIRDSVIVSNKRIFEACKFVLFCPELESWSSSHSMAKLLQFRTFSFVIRWEQSDAFCF